LAGGATVIRPLATSIVSLKAESPTSGATGWFAAVGDYVVA